MAANLDPVLWGAIGGVVIKGIDFLIAKTTQKAGAEASLRSALMKERAGLIKEIAVKDREIDRLEDLMVERDISYTRVHVALIEAEAEIKRLRAELARRGKGDQNAT